ncbi:MAG: polysaccharide deacetylase family protein [Candidatus Margulisbacteria bacterium]|nr:polysaccharide deacetylase family protein [Candidatus Margulisiibacteriota bacterium]
MNILTFDIEEWFHLLDNESTKTAKEWKNYDSRIHENMERIFAMLEKHNQKATFFCLGWIAETYPEVIRDIVARGYEVGTHTRMHQLVYEQTPKEFNKDVEFSVKTLEDITGQKVKYFRAPGFSIREDNKWAFEVLVKNGIEVDSSVFPAPRAHGGLPTYTEPVPSLLKYNGIELKELPINYHNMLGVPVIFSGGGYFRLFSYNLIKRWTSQSGYVMSYLHPRDFDAAQPMIKELPMMRRLKAYVGLSGAKKKLDNWLTDFDFVDVETAVRQIDWETVPVVKI